MSALFNGVADSGAALHSRGLHYGDGVFRTLLRQGSRWIDWDRQYAKLAGDAQALQLDAPPAQLLLAEAGQLAGAEAACVLKIILMRQSAARGYAPHTRECDRLLLRYPVPQYPARHWNEGVRAFRSPVQLAAQPRLAGLKHLNRLEQVLASRDWPAGMDEAILSDAEGHPLCGSRSNLFWIAAGRLHTPSLERCGVAGLMRDKILRSAAQGHIETRLQPADWAGLLAADEVFVCNSLIGVWPLRELEGRTWTAPGSITRRLMRALAHPQPGGPP